MNSSKYLKKKKSLKKRLKQFIKLQNSTSILIIFDKFSLSHFHELFLLYLEFFYFNFSFNFFNRKKKKEYDHALYLISGPFWSCYLKIAIFIMSFFRNENIALKNK